MNEWIIVVTVSGVGNCMTWTTAATAI